MRYFNDYLEQVCWHLGDDDFDKSDALDAYRQRISPNLYAQIIRTRRRRR